MGMAGRQGSGRAPGSREGGKTAQPGRHRRSEARAAGRSRAMPTQSRRARRQVAQHAGGPPAPLCPPAAHPGRSPAAVAPETRSAAPPAYRPRACGAAREGYHSLGDWALRVHGSSGQRRHAAPRRLRCGGAAARRAAGRAARPRAPCSGGPAPARHLTAACWPRSRCTWPPWAPSCPARCTPRLQEEGEEEKGGDARGNGFQFV